MNRTRIVFFIILAVYLGVIATALALNIASPNLVRQIYIASTIFSVGVVLLDFFGVLGGHHGGDTTGGHFGGDHTTAGDAIAGDVTAGHMFVGDHASTDSGSAHGDGGHIVSHAGHPSDDQAGHVHQMQGQQSGGPILSALSYLRLFVYFCLGFGPMGLVAMASGRSALTSLLLATPVGIVAVFLAQAFFRFQRRDTDSQLSSADLVGQKATVIVPLDSKTMGKVRIQVGPVVTEQYALAARPDVTFNNGDQVMVSSVTDECVYVR